MMTIFVDDAGQHIAGTLEALGLGAYEARERADLFRRFNLQMVEEMVAMAALFRPLPTVPLHQRQMMTIFVDDAGQHIAGPLEDIPAISPMSREISPPPDANQ
jgi:hypothetical protein